MKYIPKNLNLSKRLVFFDLETTGTDVEKDRIVEIAMIVFEPIPFGQTPPVEKVIRLNPVIPIPATATAIHGITDADVADCLLFEEVACEVADLFDGADVCGHNAANFDVPLLEAEMHRAGIEFGVGGVVVDTLRLFQGLLGHTLSEALEFYTGDTHEGAHDALSDVVATVRVLDGMIARHGLPGVPEEIVAMPPSPDWVDQDGKFRWDDAGEAIFSFGAKTRGRTLRDVTGTDAGFLDWMLSKDFSDEVKTIVRGALRGEFPVKA